MGVQLLRQCLKTVETLGLDCDVSHVGLSLSVFGYQSDVWWNGAMFGGEEHYGEILTLMV